MTFLGLLLLAAGGVLAALAWRRMSRRAALTLAVLGGLAFLAVIAGLFLAVPAIGTVLALVFVIAAAIAIARPSELPAEGPSHPSPNVRRIAMGALLGALPGLLIVGSAWLLLVVGVISADQSQAAFIGLPLTLVGGAVGATVGAVADNDGPSRRSTSAQESNKLPRK